MSFNIPKNPTIPEMGKGGVNKDNYEAKMMEYQEAAARRRLLIQTMQQEQTEEQSTRSNLKKSQHDAMMAIIGNMKA